MARQNPVRNRAQMLHGNIVQTADERTFGWHGRCRRLTKDFENLSRTQLAFVQLAMIRLMMRRIARLSNPS